MDAQRSVGVVEELVEVLRVLKDEEEGAVAGGREVVRVGEQVRVHTS